jgi:hypothetical protein
MNPTLLHALLLTSLLLASPTRAQQDFSKVEIKAVPVATNLYMLQGAGGNIGVSVGPDGILMIDDQFAPLAEKISAALHRLDPGPLRYLQIKADGLPDKWKSWAVPTMTTERWLELLYRGLSRK